MQKENAGPYSQKFFNRRLGKFVTSDTSLLYIWDAKTGDLLNTIDNHRQWYSVQFSPTDDNILIYDMVSKTSYVIEASSGKILFSIQDSTGFSSYYDPLGRFVIFNDSRFYDAKSGKYIVDLKGMNSEYVNPLSVKVGTTYAAGLLEGGVFAVWDLKDLQTTSVENDNTPYNLSNDLLTFQNTEHELKIIVNKGLNQAQSYTVYNVCGKKIQSGSISTSANELTLPYEAYQSGIYYFECTVNGNRYVHQFAVIR